MNDVVHAAVYGLEWPTLLAGHAVYAWLSYQSFIRMPKASPSTNQGNVRNSQLRQPLPNRLVRLLSEARWIALFAAFVYFVMILATYDKADPGWSHDVLVPKVHNMGGRAGAWLADLMLFVFGFSAWWWCICFLRLVWKGYRSLTNKFILDTEDAPEHDSLPH